MRFSLLAVSLLAILTLGGCANDSASTAGNQEIRTVPAGEKGVVGHLSYSIIDSQVRPTLGDDPANQRVPKDRFMLVELSVTNSDNKDASIPAVELIDDAGKTYNELTDGAGIPSWLGMIRHVGSIQTERGYVAFDAPAAHYRVKVSGEDMDKEILLDLPLNYIHEQTDLSSSTALPDVKPIEAPANKKK